ncbi:MAG: alcohol dehydrogenase catalytic domain-containing protein [Chromatiales bacterium]|jgi:threonine dehydrogenase-like Zn-dependent dehydrogenase|nr:alcohol dehydrogenase catalytic domain-containing protein [Chromatiales bacterium]
MQALVYTANEVVEIRDEPAPSATNDEVVVAIEAVGICGSDMHAYLGHDARRVPPLILGHEAAGRVIEGPNTGMRAVLNPLITCGVCNDCLGGRSNLCAERDLIGMYRPGAFAEAIAIPQRNLIAIPDGMDSGHAALTEPAATGLHAVNRAGSASARPISECRCLVYGGGSVGLFAALALAEQGAHDVQLAETNALRRATADATGACSAFDPLTTPARENEFDVIIDAVGSGITRAAASAACRPGGVIVHVGLQDNEPGLDTRRLTLQEITFIGTYTYSPVDLRAAISKLHRGALGDLSWLEQRPLAQGPAAFDDLLNGRSAAPKIVLRPQPSV